MLRNKMAFEYFYKNKEANFGPPIQRQISDGTHITFEVILKKEGKYIALRRESIPGHESPPNIESYPKGMLFFCHNLIRYGESIEKCVKRIVKEQCNVSINKFKFVFIESFIQKKDDQWAITLYIIAETNKIPKIGNYGNKITEVILFDRKNIPNDFAWWSKKELKEFIEEYD